MKISFRSCARLSGALAVVFSLAHTLPAQAQTSVPASVTGTYELSYQSTSTGALYFPIGQKGTFVIDAAKATVCYNGINYPYSSRSDYYISPDIQLASGAYVNYFLRVVLNNGALHEIVYYQNAIDGTQTGSGLLRGTKVSSATDCVMASTGGGSTALTISTEAQSVFTLAAELYPTMFINGSELRSYQGYTYKFFAGSGIYVGIKDNKIHLMGGPFGPGITDKGSVNSVLTALQAMKAAK